MISFIQLDSATRLDVRPDACGRVRMTRIEEGHPGRVTFLSHMQARALSTALSIAAFHARTDAKLAAPQAENAGH